MKPLFNNSKLRYLNTKTEGVICLDVNTSIANLATALKHSQPFAELSNARKAIEHTEEEKRLVEFEAKQQHLYDMSRRSQNTEYFAGDLEAEFRKLSQIPSLNRYFRASEAFQSYMDTVINQLFQSIAS